MSDTDLRHDPGVSSLPAPGVLVRVTAIVALVGVLVALLGIGLLLRPVTTPIQDCGTSLAFLLEGRVDETVNPDDPPPGVTRAEAEAGNARRCRERVADRAVPAGALAVGGTLVGAAAVVTELVVRLRRRRRVSRPLVGGSPTPG